LAQVVQKFHAKLFKNLSYLLTDYQLIKSYCFDKKHFTRNRKLPFQTVVLIILQLLKSSIKTGLKSFYTAIFKVDEVINWVCDSAFCRARQKIRFQLFVDLYRLLTRYFYANIGGKRWNHFRLLAVDGSELNLPSSKELLDKYGCHHTNSVGTKIPQARVSFLCDVLNFLTVDAQIESFRIGEQQMFKSLLKCVGKGDLITADSNYGHFWILKKIIKRKADFCIRINQSSNFVKDFLASGQKDVITDWVPSPKTIENCRKHKVSVSPLKVRLVRIDLSENETEVLVLSLLDQSTYNFDSIKGLYNIRWAVEEEIKKFMPRLMIEFFSSLKVCKKSIIYINFIRFIIRFL
jgi:hypothetical protein